MNNKETILNINNTPETFTAFLFRFRQDCCNCCVNCSIDDGLCKLDNHNSEICYKGVVEFMKQEGVR